VSTLDKLLQLKSKAQELAAELEQAKLDKAHQYVADVVLELETRIHIAQSNRR
jgi:hypothetical protein